MRSVVQIHPDPPLFLILPDLITSLASANFGNEIEQAEKKPLIQGYVVTRKHETFAFLALTFEMRFCERFLFWQGAFE